MPSGWLKRGSGLLSMVPKTRMRTNTVKHHDVPRFGALRRDNTPSPADPTISNNSGYNECSMSCMRGRRRGPLVTTLSLLSICGWKCNNYGGVPHTGGVPGALIGRARGTEVTIQWGGPSSQSPSCWDPQDMSCQLTRSSSAALHTARYRCDAVNSVVGSSVLSACPRDLR